MFSRWDVISKAMLLGVLLGGSAVLCGCRESVTADENKREPDTADTAADTGTVEGRAILRVLKADRTTPQFSVATDTRTSEYFQQVIANMSRIELYECPADFRLAYKRHVLAWRQCLRTVQSQGEKLARIADWNAVSVLNGTEPRDDLEREVFASLGEIEKTFEECVRIAELYGVSESEYRL